MKLKQAPGDFQVAEDFHFTPSRGGEHCVHLLRKEKLDTLEALSRVARAAGLPRTAISFAGLKDRQGITEQWISIPGVHVDLDEPGLRVTFVGRSLEPVTSQANRGNRFEIVVRDLTLHQAARLRRNLPAVLKGGLPNYFDDQRFGCLRHGQGFLLRELLHGRPEKALHALLARPSPVAEGGDVKLKGLLARHWGDWEACLAIARGPRYRPIFQHLLRNTGDFEGALSLVTPRLKLIHAYAWQSWVWNRAVSRYLERFVTFRERVWLENLSGRLLAWRYLEADTPDLLLSRSLPLPAPGAVFEDRLFRAVTLEVLEKEGLDLDRLQVRGVRGMDLRPLPRALVLRPLDLEVSRLQTDERNKGRSKVVLRFSLPRGAYATLVVRRLFAEPTTPMGHRFPSRPQADFRRPRRGRDPFPRGGRRGRRP